MQRLAFSLTSRRRRQGRQVAGQGGLGGQVLGLSSGWPVKGSRGCGPGGQQLQLALLCFPLCSLQVLALQAMTSCWHP